MILTFTSSVRITELERLKLISNLRGKNITLLKYKNPLELSVEIRLLPNEISNYDVASKVFDATIEIAKSLNYSVIHSLKLVKS